GGAGFIGSWVADTLLARGDDVVIVDEVCCNSYEYDCRLLLKRLIDYVPRWFWKDKCIKLTFWSRGSSNKICSLVARVLGF
ncbi:unnamed protein product, partial [Laminaria digitata]